MTNYKHISNIRIGKDISSTNPSNYVMLYFLEDFERNELLSEKAKIIGEKEEIIDFFKYFFNLAKTNNLFVEPMEVNLNRNNTTYIVIENEEDIYEIFDENSPKAKSYSDE